MKRFYSCSKEPFTFASALKMNNCPFCKERLFKKIGNYDNAISCPNCSWKYGFRYDELSLEHKGKTFRKQISNLNDKSLGNLLNNLTKRALINRIEPITQK